MLLADDHARAFMPYPAVAVPSAAEGSLAGLTLAVKDLFDVAGYPTSCGNPHLLAASGAKTRTAPTIQRLLDAGARFVGKTQTDELAWSLYGMNPHFGTPLNTVAPERIPGGSSSGSASAVAARLADIGIGTDTGGSVRGPASFCGLWGFRPTQGRISLDGCMTLARSFDTCGFLARDGATMARVGEVLLGADPHALPVKPRLLMARDMFARLGEAARSALAGGLKRVTAAAGPAEPVDVYGDAAPEDMAEVFRILQSREILAEFSGWLDTARPQLSAPLAKRFRDARAITDAQALAAGHRREVFQAGLDVLLGLDGVLIAPVVHDAALRLDADQAALDAYRPAAIALLCVAGLAGLPQVTVPAGRVDGAPIGLSLIGPRGSDASLLVLARRLWGDRPAVG